MRFKWLIAVLLVLVLHPARFEVGHTAEAVTGSERAGLIATGVSGYVLSVRPQSVLKATSEGAAGWPVAAAFLLFTEVFHNAPKRAIHQEEEEKIPLVFGQGANIPHAAK